MSFMRRRTLLMLAGLAIAAATTPMTSLVAAENKRLALVVGNSAYQNVSPLINPANDATDIAQKLKSRGVRGAAGHQCGPGARWSPFSKSSGTD